MMICSCRGVNDHAIAAAVTAGARTCQDIARMCGAGSRCGGCTEAISEVLVRVERTCGAEVNRHAA